MAVVLNESQNGAVVQEEQEAVRLIDLPSDAACQHLLKHSSYFNVSLPDYINFEPLLEDVSDVLSGRSHLEYKASKKRPADYQHVNYQFVSNKDGRLAWRPFELIHPAIYVSLVNLICEPENWAFLQQRFREFETGVVECCSHPVVSQGDEKDVAAQVLNWWLEVEQRSLRYSLEYTHLLHTDVTDCYGTLYTHSIAWALHGLETAKRNRKNSLLGNRIDAFIRDGRYGQTNGISQGSVLMDFVAELVLGYVDTRIAEEIDETADVAILRYRDDYRIFANSDEEVEAVLKIVSDKLREVGMRLGVSKTFSSTNVVEGSIKPDKLAAIVLEDLGTTNAQTVQKQLLRLHTFGQQYPNSGALHKLLSSFHRKILKLKSRPSDLDVQVAIATDIAYVSPRTFPVVAGILSHLISLAHGEEKIELWNLVKTKMRRVPYNGYMEIWLQRVIETKEIGLKLDSDEPICQIVNGKSPELWNSKWIAKGPLLDAIDVRKIVVADVAEAGEVIRPEEVQLFAVHSL